MSAVASPLPPPAGPPGTSPRVPPSPTARGPPTPPGLGSPGGGVSSSAERIYSAKQLSEALRSGLAAVKDQLQVLAILDGTALTWPGVAAAVDDLSFLTDVVGQTVRSLEAGRQRLQTQRDESLAEALALRDALAAATAARDDNARQLADARREGREAARAAAAARKEGDAALAAARQDAEQVRQELWALEKQRAELASELDRAKADLEFVSGEMSVLRSTNAEQATSITSLKEELAARRADVGHLKAAVSEARSSAAHLKEQLAAAQEAAAAANAALAHARQDRQHYEKEAERLGEESSRLGAELERAARDVSRLKEWADVVKKVEGDKLREEQAAHARTRAAADATRADAERRLAAAAGEAAALAERLGGREGELELGRKAAALLQLQMKDVHKQLVAAVGERNAAAAAREEALGQVAHAQAETQRVRFEAAQREKEAAAAEAAGREAAAAERARLQALLDEAQKEVSLCRTLGEGWQRDTRETRAKLAAEQQRVAGLMKELEGLRGQISEGRMEVLRTGAASETQVALLRSQLASKDEEVRRAKADAASLQKQLQKTIERLQREVDASAAEIARLKSADDVLFTRLPAVGARPAGGIAEELEALRRALRERLQGPLGSAPGQLPPPRFQVPQRYPAAASAAHLATYPQPGGGAPPLVLPSLGGAGSPHAGGVQQLLLRDDRPPHLRNNTR